MRMSYGVLVVGAVAMVSCGQRDAEGRLARDTSGRMGHMDSAGMSMPGMQMMSRMQAHMDSMARMSPGQMRSMMAGHEAMMSQMMDRMGADMRDMNMPNSPEWMALSDSVKQDLAELPTLQGEQLAARMRAHDKRVRRLIAAHEQMMKP